MTSSPPSPEDGAPPPNASPARRRRARGLLLAMLAAPLMVALALLLLTWALKSESGTAWVLARVPGLSVEDARGSLVGDFSARRVQLQLPGDGGLVRIDALQWQDLTLAWNRSPLLWGELHVRRLTMDRLTLQLAPSKDAEPSKPPTDLLLPLALFVEQLDIAELSFEPGKAPLRGISGRLALGDEGGELHRAELRSLAWQTLRLQGQARVATRDTMALRGSFTLAQDADAALPWQAALALDGPLRAPQLTATLRAARQALDLQATLLPFDALPLQRLQARAHELDLSALLDSLPATALTGSADLNRAPGARGAGLLRLRSQLANGRAGRLDQGRAPLRSLQLDLQLDPSDWSRLQLRQLDATLPGQGQLRATGQSSGGDGSELRLRLDGLDSREIDARWPALRARGELRLQTRAALSGDLLAQPLKLQGQLSGELGGGPAAGAPREAKNQPPLPLTVELQALLAPQSLQLQSLQLHSGPARLQASAELALRKALSLDQGWSLKSEAQIQGLDPRRFVPALAAASSAPHELHGRLQARLAGGPATVWPEGTAQLEILPSQWAGLPLQGRLDYRRSGAARPELQARLALADASLQASSTVAAQGTAAAATSDLQLQLGAELPRLASLQPLLQGLWPKARLDGQLRADLRLNLAPGTRGGAAQFASDGELQGRALNLAGLPGLSTARLDSLQGQWQLASAAERPLLGRVELNGLTLPQLRLEQARLNLDGSWAKHRLLLETQGRLALPALLAPTAGPLPREDASAARKPGPVLYPARARLALEGALLPRERRGGADLPALWAHGGRWQAQALELLAQPAATGTLPWLQASGLGLTLELDPGATPTALQLAPGRMELLGAGLRWARAELQAPQGWQAELALEPLKAAPLLARLQPDFGWGGDLLINGQLSTRRDARGLVLELALERSSGDLSVTDELNTQWLGLSDLRLGLQADRGVWHLTQGIAGKNLGAVGGALTARVGDPFALPGAQAALEGVLEAQVANLGNWGAWVPAGWRLGGSLFASMSLSGRLGSPQLHGRAGGSALSVRNPLLGVDMAQGEFALQMDGQQALLERFSAKAGDGTLNLKGPLVFGAKPQAKLQIEARRFALLQRVDRRVVASGDATLELGLRSLALNGRFAVDEGLVDFSRAGAPQLDADVQVLREPSQAQAKAAQGTDKPVQVQLDLDLDLGERLRLKGYGIDTRLGGTLKLAQSGTGKPTLNGSVRTVGGSFAAYGQKLTVEKGVFSFVGPLDNPRLDVLAIKPGLDEVRVGVTVGGTAHNPRIKLYSDPEMSETAKLSWLVLGRSPDNLGRSDTVLMQRAALALLSGSGESSSDKLIKSLGLDELSFGGDTEDARGTVVRLGKQISRNVYLGYERGLNATTGSWQLIYRLANRFTLRALAGEEQGLDLIWQWKWE